MIEFNHVTFAYRGSDAPALKDFSLKVEPGECVVLCGKSGCGKSTALRLVNGMIPNFHDGSLAGSVSVAGRDPFDCEMWELAGTVGTVFQNPRTQFYATDTTAEVAFGCENMGLPRDEIARRVDEAFALAGVAHLRDRSIFELSGGEKQAIAFASVSAMRPRVLVLDEPSSNLDLGAIEVLGAIVARLKKEGATILVAEHRLGYLEAVADRVILLEDGAPARVLSMGEVDTMGRAERIETGIRPLRSRIESSDTRRSEARGGDGVSCSHVRYSYRRSEAVVLDVDRARFGLGRVTAVLGRNGAGKSTFSRCLAGLMRPNEGAFSLAGRTLSERERLAASYVVMQDVNHQLFCPTVAEEIALSMNTQDPRPDVGGLARTLDLEGLEQRHPMSLSGGQKQRVAIASALASGKKVLIFDEPTSGLDYFHMTEVARLLRQLAEDGAAVLVVTHDMDLVAECCDAAVLFERGSVLRESDVDETFLTDVSMYLKRGGLSEG